MSHYTRASRHEPRFSLSTTLYPGITITIWACFSLSTTLYPGITIWACFSLSTTMQLVTLTSHQPTSERKLIPVYTPHLGHYMPNHTSNWTFFLVKKAGCGWPSCIISFQMRQERRGLVNQLYSGWEWKMRLLVSLTRSESRLNK